MLLKWMAGVLLVGYPKVDFWVGRDSTPNAEFEKPSELTLSLIHIFGWARTMTHRKSARPKLARLPAS